MAAVEPFLVPPSSSCLDIEITTSQPGPLSPPIKMKQSPLIQVKRAQSPSTHSSASLPINSSLAKNSSKCSSPSEYGILEQCCTAGNGDVRDKSSSRNLSDSDYFDHLIAEQESPPDSQERSDSIYDVPRSCQPVEDAVYQVPPNNQPVDDAIYKVPTNNNDIYQSPSNIPVTEVCDEENDIPKELSSDLGSEGMPLEIKAPDCENGASSDEEDFYQVPLTNISRPKLSNGSNEVHIPSHYDTYNRLLLLSKGREVSRVLSPLDTSQSGANSPNEVTPSSPAQEFNSGAQRAHLLKRGPIPYKRALSKPASPLPDSPDTAPAQRNVESELQALRQEFERELLCCKTEGELWRSDCEDGAQKLSLALSQLETERAAVRRLTEELSELRADCQPISCSPLSETHRTAGSRGKAPIITKPLVLMYLNYKKKRILFVCRLLGEV